MEKENDPFWRYFAMGAMGIVFFLLAAAAIGYIVLFGDFPRH